MSGVRATTYAAVLEKALEAELCESRIQKDNTASHPPVNDMEAPPRLPSAGISASSLVNRLSSLPLVIHDCKYEIDERLNDVDKSIFLFALNFHPEKDGKIGVGAQDIKVS
ncbi:hypothetical protein F8388_024867 [Cannabis sativa]|uniref:Uncharacterized protein n=1 Tax=Cannabis sativa TaxID=3483 RepID=A0A7J6H7F4_CANSA|nr:hypothetical protein F8388_024867 [Cannabis sativa]